MKQFLQGVVLKSLLLTLLLTGVVFASAAPVPSFTHLPHHLKVNKCAPFSDEAVLFLHKQGIPAVRIGIGWQNPSAGRGYHAALIFKHEGKFYVMDNEHRKPVRFSGKTEQSAAVAIIGLDFYTSVWIVNDANQKVKPRTLEELFKSNPAWLEQFNIAHQ